MYRGRRLARLAVLALALALVVPAAAGAATSKTDKKQNKALVSLGKNIKKANKAINVLKTSVAAQGTSIKAIDTRLKTIETAAPAIIQGLQDLKTGLTAAGAGLQSLKTLATSTEYGIAQLIVLEPTPNPQEGSFVETPDIPDTVQQAQAEQQFLAQQTGNLAVAFGVRSAESDGDGTVPAAHCKVTVTNEAGATQTTAANAALGGLPFQPVNTKSSLTSTDPANAGFPFGLKQVGPDADQTTTFVSTVPVTAGDTYTVGLSCVDLSPSTTDPPDPSA
jgi:uncharacterized phage infection (PIP) family protein YhgE